MAKTSFKVLVPFLLVLMAGAAVATPPGTAAVHESGYASCNIKKYKYCYNSVHACPKSCPYDCAVDCASCKPICVGGTNPSPDYPTPSTATHKTPPSSSSHSSNSSNSSPSSSSSSSASSSASSSSSSSSSSASSSSSSSSSSSAASSSSASSPSSSSSSSPHTPSTPKTPPHSSSTPSPSSPTSSGNGQPPSPKTARCGNKNYPRCYNTKHVCPKACSGGCEVDCNTCKPVCKCDKPGAVCQDPRFIGGDGITFYFHGKKDSNFCLVSDPNLHINAHFIGRRNENMKRDFTWVQSIVILFDNHQLFVGAQKTATWEDSIDRLALSFDGEPITLHESEGAAWRSSDVSIVREASTNNIIIEVEGRFRIIAKVVPITEEDSRIHKYQITKEDCFAHLDLGFKFFSLSNKVSGVLGQTYKPNYVSRVNIGAKMPVMGGGNEYQTTSLFSPDCSVTRFVGNTGSSNMDITMVADLELPSLSCTSGIDGQGVVCKR